jgi:hypothetical protein
MGLTTLLLYLIGNRRAIMTVAAHPRTLLVGLLFVLAAGFAREYDGESLVDEPWYLLLPLGASLALSLCLYSLLRIGPKRPADDRMGFWAGYRVFLGLFWMTAPLALLYAVPYEHFLSAYGSVKANLWTLAVVSAWRVLLISRVAAVVSGRSNLATLGLTLFFAAIAAFAALAVVPRPVLDLMGGIRLSEGDQLLARTAFRIQVLIFYSSPVIAIAASFGLAASAEWRRPRLADGQVPAVSRALWAFAVAAVVVWAAILPVTQPAQRLRHQVEDLFRRRQVADGLRLLDQHSQSDFPPHWDPPPRLGYPREPVELPDVLDQLDQIRTPWVRAVYVDKLERSYLDRWAAQSIALMPEESERLLKLLQTMPEGPELKARNAEAMAYYRESQPLEPASQPQSQPATSQSSP